MPKPRRPIPPRASLPPQDPLLHEPTAARPVRGKTRRMEYQMDIQPHWHSWGQLVFSITGAVRVSAQGQSGDNTYIVPPSRAVWIPTGVVHAVTAIEQADLRTLYLHEKAVQALGTEADWTACRVLDVTPLLRELVLQMAVEPGAAPAAGADLARELAIGALILDELRRARSVQLGLPLPRAGRLRRVCEAMLDQPLRHADIEGWAAEAATSPRTLSRWFSDELGTSYGQWRQQLLLAKALSMAARKQPMRLIAAELGYASPSAFSAMVTRAVGMPPSRFFAEA